MLHLMKIEWRKIRVPVVATVFLLTVVSSILSCTLYQSYTLHYELEAWEIGTEVFSLLFPLLVALPLCWNLYYERKNQFLLYVAPRVTINRYLKAKWGVHALAAFAIIFIPYFVSAVFALYVKGPIHQVKMAEGIAPFQHIFLQTFTEAPLLYAVCMSIWKGVIGILTMTMGFVLALYVKNIFVILTGPFVYAILENFALSILQFPMYRLVTAFDPTNISAHAVNMGTLVVGPGILCIVILAIWLYNAKIKKIAVVEV